MPNSPVVARYNDPGDQLIALILMLKCFGFSAHWHCTCILKSEIFLGLEVTNFTWKRCPLCCLFTWMRCNGCPSWTLHLASRRARRGIVLDSAIMDKRGKMWLERYVLWWFVLNSLVVLSYVIFHFPLCFARWAQTSGAALRSIRRSEGRLACQPAVAEQGMSFFKKELSLRITPHGWTTGFSLQRKAEGNASVMHMEYFETVGSYISTVRLLTGVAR